MCLLKINYYLSWSGRKILHIGFLAVSSHSPVFGSNFKKVAIIACSQMFDLCKYTFQYLEQFQNTVLYVYHNIRYPVNRTHLSYNIYINNCLLDLITWASPDDLLLYPSDPSVYPSQERRSTEKHCPAADPDKPNRITLVFYSFQLSWVVHLYHSLLICNVMLRTCSLHAIIKPSTWSFSHAVYIALYINTTSEMQVTNWLSCFHRVNL